MHIDEKCVRARTWQRHNDTTHTCPDFKGGSLDFLSNARETMLDKGGGGRFPLIRHTFESVNSDDDDVAYNPILTMLPPTSPESHTHAIQYSIHDGFIWRSDNHMYDNITYPAAARSRAVCDSFICTCPKSYFEIQLERRLCVKAFARTDAAHAQRRRSAGADHHHWVMGCADADMRMMFGQFRRRCVCNGAFIEIRQHPSRVRISVFGGQTESARTRRVLELGKGAY